MEIPASIVNDFLPTIPVTINVSSTPPKFCFLTSPTPIEGV